MTDETKITCSHRWSNLPGQQFGTCDVCGEYADEELRKRATLCATYENRREQWEKEEAVLDDIVDAARVAIANG